MTQQDTTKNGAAVPVTARIADEELAEAIETSAVGASSVSIGGDVVDSIIVTGDQNNVVGTLIVGSAAGVQELELRIDPVPGTGYVVRASIGDERRPVTSWFLSPFSELELHGARSALRRGQLNSDAQIYGDRLFQALFTQPVLQLYRLCESRPNPIRLRLILNAPQLHELPWELLRDPESGQWLIQTGMITRGAENDRPTRKSGLISTLSPFRVLVVDLQRRHQESQPVSIDAPAMERSVADLEQARHLEVTRSSPTDIDALASAIARAAGPSRWLDVVHILGLQDNEQWPIQRIGEMLTAHGVQVAAFSTVPSSQASTPHTTLRAGFELLASGLAAVLGVPLSGNEERDAQVFRGLYASLCDGDPADLALVHSLRPRSRASDERDSVAAFPVCYAAAGEVIRFDIQSPPPILLSFKTWRPWLRERVTAGKAAAATATVTVAAAVALAFPSLWSTVFPTPLPKMASSMNIAVAEFGQIDARGAVQPWDRGAELASRFATDVDERRGPLDDAAASVGGSVEIRGPDLTGRLLGATPDDRERSASELAGDIRADLIVSGNVSPDGRRFVPEIFVSGRDGVSTVDPGFYTFGEIALRPNTNLFVSVNDQQELQQRLIQSTRSIMQFVLGVNAYATRNYDKAKDLFVDAADAAGVDLASGRGAARAPEGLEMLHLLMGDVASKQAAAAVSASTAERRSLFDQARGHYDRALALDSEFARAHIGLAEVTFLQAAGTCPRSSPSIDVNGLKSSISLYERAQRAKHQTAIANIGPKSHFGIGRATYCLARAGAPGYSSDDARRELQQVIDAFSPTNRRMKDWAIEAHALIGGMSLVEADYPRAASAFAAAIDLSAFQTGEEQGGDAERRYLFCRNLGRAHGHIGSVPSNGAGLPQVTREPECQEQFQVGFDLGRQGQ